MDRIRIKIDVTKIDEASIFVGEKGKYIDLTLLPNRDGEDKYGNHYMCVQEIARERRDAGERNPILGNAKIQAAKAQQKQSPTQESGQEDDDDIPF